MPVAVAQLLCCFSQTVPVKRIQSALAKTGKGESRRRALPAALVVLRIVCLGLVADAASRQGLAHLWPPGLASPTRKSICHARYRLFPRPLIELFRMLERPLATARSLPVGRQACPRRFIAGCGWWRWGRRWRICPTRRRASGSLAGARRRAAAPLSPKPSSLHCSRSARTPACRQTGDFRLAGAPAPAPRIGARSGAGAPLGAARDAGKVGSRALQFGHAASGDGAGGAVCRPRQTEHHSGAVAPSGRRLVSGRCLPKPGCASLRTRRRGAARDPISRGPAGRSDSAGDKSCSIPSSIRPWRWPRCTTSAGRSSWSTTSSRRTSPAAPMILRALRVLRV